MLGQIGEKIDTLVLFQQGHMYPRYFIGHHRLYKILKAATTWHSPEGQFRGGIVIR